MTQPPEDWQRLADHVRTARKDAGFPTRRSLAKATGITERTLGKLENGERVGADTLDTVAKAVGWPPDGPRRILAGGGPEPAPAESPRLSPVPDPAPPLDLSKADDALIGMFIEAWREDSEDDRKLKETLRRTWQLYTVAKGDRDTVVDALAALLHRGVPRLYLRERERAREEGRESS